MNKLEELKEASLEEVAGGKFPGSDIVLQPLPVDFEKREKLDDNDLETVNGAGTFDGNNKEVPLDADIFVSPKPYIFPSVNP